MAIRPYAWLRRMMGSKGDTQPQETMPAGPAPQPTPKRGPTGKTRLRETTAYQEDTPLPSYSTLDLRGGTPQPPRTTNENVSLENSRARNPPCQGSYIMGPPPHRTTPFGAAKAAASTAANGYVRALDERNRRMVAAGPPEPSLLPPPPRALMGPLSLL